MTPVATVTTSTPINGLTRSRRSHFSRKDSTPEFNGTGGNSSAISAAGNSVASQNDSSRSSTAVPAQRIVHEYQRMIYYAKSPHSWALPANWAKICESFPTIIRNKVNPAPAQRGLAGNRRDAFAMRSASLTASLECTN